MNDPSEVESFSSALEKSCVELATRFSRRTILARALKVALMTVGVTTLYATVGPVPTARAADCTPCEVCGMCGKPCAACGGNNSTCPPGTGQGVGFWSACCFCGTCGTYRYYDCCGTSSCADAGCTQGCPQQAWCAGSGFAVYNCSIAVNVGSCSPC